MNRSISNNIRNTEFRGNQAQQGSAIFLNNSQPVSPHDLVEAVYHLLSHALCMEHGLLHKATEKPAALAHACSTKAKLRRRPPLAMLGTAACLPVCIHKDLSVLITITTAHSST